MHMHRAQNGLKCHWFAASNLRIAVMLVTSALLSFSAITEAQVVRVGFYENAPKLYTSDLGEIVGFFPQIIEYIAEQEGWTLEYVPGTWAECLSRLEAGEIDLMPDVAYSTARSKVYGFTEEPLFINWGIIYTSPDSGIESIPDLAGKRIAVMDGSIHTEGEQGIKAILAQFDIRSTYVEVPDYAAVFETLQADEADVGVVNRLFGLANEKQYGVRQTPIVFNPRELRFAYLLDSEFGKQLAERIDLRIRDMKMDPNSVYHRSIETYLLGRAPDVLQQAPRWLPWVLGGAGGLILLSGLTVLILRRRQRRLRRELTTSEIRFDAMFEQAAIGLAIADPKSQRLLRVNTRFSEMLGYSSTELTRMHLSDILHPEDLERDTSAMHDLAVGRSTRLLVYERCIRKDKTEIFGALSLAMVREQNGDSLYWIGGIQDITEQKKAEEERDRLFKHSLDMMGVVGFDGYIKQANPAWSEVLGWSEDELLQTPLITFVHPEDVEDARAVDRQLRAGEPVVMSEGRYRSSDGSYRWISWNSFPMEGEELIFTVGRDITERRQRAIEYANQCRDLEARTVALTESEARLREGQAIALLGHWVLDLEADSLYWSDEVYRIFDAIPQSFALSYERFLEIVHPEDRERVDRAWAAAMRGGPPYNIEHRLLIEGKVKWVRERAKLELGDDGKAIRGVGTVQDVTERKQVETALRESEERLRSVIEQSIDGIVLINHLGIVDVWNQGQERITGIRASEAIGQPFWEVQARTIPKDRQAPELTDRLRVATMRLLAGEDSLWAGRFLEQDIERPDGQKRVIQIGSFPIDLSEQRMLGSVTRDITDQKQAEQELEEHRENLERLVVERTEDLNTAIEAANAAMFRHNLLTDEVAWDERWFEIAGITEDEFDGRHETWRRLVHSDDLPKAEAYIANALASQADSIRHEYRIIRADGEIRHIESRSRILRDEDGKATAIVGMNSDITERRKAEERVRQLSQAVEESPVSVVITNVNGDIEYVNPKFCKVTGYTADEVVGRNPRVLKAGDQPESFYKELWDTILAGREWRGEFCNRKKSGDLFWESASISPIRDKPGGITHFVAIKEDITERKHAAWELEQAKRDAESANQAKSDFLANMSHELRTPLNAVIGFSEVLEDGTFGELNDKQRHYVGNILQSGRHLLSLINDILDLSKIEAGKMGLEIVDVAISRLIFESLIFFQEKAHQHRLELVTDLSEDVSALTIQADERMLKQIFFNLLSNATNFTPDNGTISVEGRIQGSNLLIGIRDTGIGMKPEDLFRVFEEFEQVDTSYAKLQQGTGLGLALARRLVELHGGRIWVESEGEEKGSMFAFTLPIQNRNRKESKE